MQSLADTLYPRLHDYAQGTRGQFGPSALRVAKTINVEYSRGVDEIGSFIGEIARKLACAPISYALAVGALTHLCTVTNAFTSSLLSYDNGKLHLEAVVESAHTASEHILKATALTRREKKNSYQALLEMAKKRGILSNELARRLSLLKEHRKGTKHRRQAVPQQLGEQLVMASLHACQQMLSTLRERDHIH